MTAYDPPIHEIESARSPGWMEVFCYHCDWYTTGTEPVCEEAWHEHMRIYHPRRYNRN